MDVETVQPGSDFTQAVGRAVRESDVAPAVIGRRGRPERDERAAEDATTLPSGSSRGLGRDCARSITVIPALVTRQMPAPAALPPTQQDLASRQAAYLPARRRSTDCAARWRRSAAGAGRLCYPTHRSATS